MISLVLKTWNIYYKTRFPLPKLLKDLIQFKCNRRDFIELVFYKLFRLNFKLNARHLKRKKNSEARFNTQHSYFRRNRIKFKNKIIFSKYVVSKRSTSKNDNFWRHWKNRYFWRLVVSQDLFRKVREHKGYSNYFMYIMPLSNLLKIR